MLQLPKPLPDELFASLLARLGRLNGIADLRDLMENDQGAWPCTSFVDAKLNLPMYCERISNVYGDPEALLENLTLLGFRRQLGEVSETEWDGIVQGNQRVSLATLTFSNRSALRYCKSCIQYDSDSYGASYWHLHHQFPVVQTCAKHGERLNRFTFKRAILHQAFPLPSDAIDSTSVAAEIEILQSAALGVARMVEDLHSTKCGRLTAGQINIALLDGLAGISLVTGNSFPRIQNLMHYLKRMLSGKTHTVVSAAEMTFYRSLVRSVRKPEAGVVSGRVLLLYCLYGNCSMLRQRLHWLEVMGGYRAVPLLEKHNQKTNDIRALHRSNCLRYMAENKGCSRLDFTRSEYRSFRWLHHNDNAWLSTYLPIPVRETNQLELFS